MLPKRQDNKIEEFTSTLVPEMKANAAELVFTDVHEIYLDQRDADALS